MNRTKQIHLMVTEKEKKQITKNAKKAGMNISDFCRNKLKMTDEEFQQFVRLQQ